jgi:hypothetical protein
MLNAYLCAVVSTVQANQQEPMEEENDGLDIQSISVVKEAEFIFNKIDEGKGAGGSGSNTTPEKKRTINLEAFKIIRVIGKGVYVVQFAWTLCQLRIGLRCVGHACCKVLLLVLVLYILRARSCQRESVCCALPYPSTARSFAWYRVYDPL